METQRDDWREIDAGDEFCKYCWNTVVMPVALLRTINNKSRCRNDELCQVYDRVEYDDCLLLARGVTNTHTARIRPGFLSTVCVVGLYV